MLTFSVGLLVASFFVAVAAPSFNFKKRNHRCREYRENTRLRMENESLRRDNESLKRRSADNELKSPQALDMDDVPAPPPLPPPAPRGRPNGKFSDPTAPAVIR
ncbi:MAG: hypothetical protein M3384_16060 [Acidobacteriota bacterium]|nr:hypothetical protein [Acidobacteriota bacterium]